MMLAQITLALGLVATSASFQDPTTTKPDDAKQNWESGKVWVGDRWVTPDAVAQLLKSHPTYSEYLQHREKFSDSASDHFQLSQWCKTKGLLDEQRSHLYVASHLAPDDSRAPKALGLRSYKGTWLTDDQIAESRQREPATLKGVHEWKNRIAALRAEFGQTDPQRQEKAFEQLSAIRDPLAIPALEEMAMNGEREAAAVVRVLGSITHIAATRSLMRFAVWHRSAGVRAAATAELSHREPEHFVQELIELLQPLEASETWTRSVDGRPVRISQMQDSGKNYIDILLTAKTRNPFYADNGGQTDGPRRQFHSWSQQNQFRTQNARQALIAVAGEDLGAEPRAWRDWWGKLSYSIPGERVQQSRVTYFRMGFLTPAELGNTPVSIMSAWSCFVAGTPVWTRHGLVPIDHVKLGDLVLALNPESGELSYRPVVNRTIRGKAKTLDLVVNGETISATPGHMFWKSHIGWSAARDLIATDTLRASDATVQVESVSNGIEENVYNLVVSEFNTYFVGRSRVLVHDISPITDVENR